MMTELKKNDIFEAEIENWSSDGAGVCRIGGRAVFVPGAIPGETWRVRIVKVTSSAVYGKGEERLSSSPDRTVPDCPAFGKCGGCALRHVRYEAELDFKLQRVNEAYRRIGGLDLRAEEILGGETEGYRNKGIYALGPGPVCGFFRPRSHQVIPVERCRIQTEGSDRAAQALRRFMEEHRVPAYDEATGKGLVRHVFTRSAFSTGAMQVTVVAAGGFGAKTEALCRAIREACPEVTGIILNVNKSRGNTVLAGDFYTLWGQDTLRDTLCGLDFSLSPRSFYQVNPAQAERLYARALAYAAPEGRGLVLDLYCGAGTISLCLARGAEAVIGAEIVPEAVENARENAARNGVNNVEFICADAGQAAGELLRRGTRPDAVVVDPPRKGLSPDVIESVCSMAPDRVVYVSCDVATQARDLRLFAERGYKAVKATAVDMFPRTSHVETVCLLSKLKSTQHIEVELDMDELDLTAAEKKATYDEIKAYVLEHSGLKVSSLYIAQVKQKCGIIERENYNKPKSEDAKQPQCPPEKEEAIKEALRHFGMI
ncbi:MAG: 23S rRNA (uracil(1939)-C(5))-methyltransferase RlmD [Oscillospiraceae bacterium]